MPSPYQERMRNQKLMNNKPIGPSQNVMKTQVMPPQQMEQQSPSSPMQQPEWNRENFKKAWMSSGVSNVGGMNDWLKNSGWGSHVGVGGSKGDRMYLPGGDTIDGVLAAGAGGNRGGPQWTGKGNWMGGGDGPQQQPIGGTMGGSSWGYGGGGYPQTMGQQFGSIGQQNPGMQSQMQPQQMQQMQQQMREQQQNQMHQQYRNRMQQRPSSNPYQRQNPYQMQQQSIGPSQQFRY